MKRELTATVAGREVEISVESADDGQWRVMIEGREHLVDARPVRPGTWSLIIGNRSHLVDLDPRKGGTAVSSGLAEAVIAIEDARKRKLAKAAARSGATATGELIRAPIAGKVVKLLVADGDVVAVGQGVVVIEAMKMENELAAERGGKVTGIHKQAGQPVDTGDLLVTLV